MSTPGTLGLKWFDQDLTGSYVGHFELVLPDGPFENGLKEFDPAAKRSSCNPRTVPLPSQSGDAIEVFNLLSLILFPKVFAGAPTEKGKWLQLIFHFNKFRHIRTEINFV